MIPPSPTPDEEARLQALRDLDILDTPPEVRFDQITRLAALIFRVPIALVSLVDEDRQWFKSCVGLDVDQTDRSVSFCAHAIHSPTIMVVEDASKDERFRDNPLVTADPGIRFYAGRPLTSPDGALIGTLCVIDTQPRVLSSDDAARLDALGQWVELELQNRAFGERDTITKAARRHQFWAISRDLLCVAGTDGYFKDVSPSFSTTLGYPASTLLSTPFLDLIHSDDVAATLSELERLKDGEETLHFRNRYRHQSGRFLWLDWTAVPSGQTIYAVARDVTDEVGNRRRLDRVVARLQESTEELRDLTRLVSHDLRAPIRRMNDNRDDLPPEVAYELDTMSRMIDGLVAYERVFLVDIPDAVVDLDDLWEEVIDASTNELKEATVVKEGSMGSAVGNADQLVMVLRNLVDNSIKYRAPERPLEIRVQAFTMEDGTEIHYRDNGIGVPDGVAARIWQPFQGQPTGESGGHGMGLPIAKRVLERHGGDIQIGRPDQGAHFIVRVPSAPLAGTAPEVTH